MIFRALDVNGDFTFGRGKQNYLRQIDAIREDIRTALLLFLRDAFWDMDSGVDWWNLNGGKQPQAQTEILFQTRKRLLSREGVTGINWVDYTFDPYARSLRIRYSVNTVFSGIIEEIVDADPFAFTDSLGNFLADQDSNLLAPYHV